MPIDAAFVSTSNVVKFSDSEVSGLLVFIVNFRCGSVVLVYTMPIGVLFLVIRIEQFRVSYFQYCIAE